MRPDPKLFKREFASHRKLVRKICRLKHIAAIKNFIRKCSPNQLNFLIDAIYFVVSGRTSITRERFLSVFKSGQLSDLQRIFATASKVSHLKSKPVSEKLEQLFRIDKVLRLIICSYL